MHKAERDLSLGGQAFVDGTLPRRGLAYVEPAKDIKEVGNIQLPETAQNPVGYGCVLLLGAPKYTKGGQEMPWECEEGDWVVFDRWASTHFEFAEHELICIVPQQHITAVIG